MRTGLKTILPVLLLLTILSGCATTTVRQHPDFASGKRKINVVAVLPADVEFRHLVFTGENERDAARETTIAAEIETEINNILQSHGYTPKNDILKKVRGGDKEFNFQLEQLKSAYQLVAKDLYAQTLVQVEESTKFKLGVGPLANPFASVSGADALMLARYHGFDKSDGLIAKEVLASALLAALTGSYAIPVNHGGQIELSLIDGVSGDILWSNAAASQLNANAALGIAVAKLPNSPSALAAVKPATAAPAGDAPKTDSPTAVEAAKAETAQIDSKPAVSSVAAARESSNAASSPAPLQPKAAEQKFGKYSYVVEKMAKANGCQGGTGAYLITNEGPIENYQVACDAGVVYLAHCEYGKCAQQ